MMSVKDYETKRLIEKGIANIRNPFIKEMISVQSFSISKGGGLCPFTISFYIVPQINGTIRVGSQDEKSLLFQSMLDFKGYTNIPSTKRGCKGQMEQLVAQACRNCTNIKKNQSKMVDANLNIIEKIIADKNLTENKIIAVQLNRDLNTDRNLTGLIANQLMAKYKHPILLLTQRFNEDGKITWEGSGRGYETADFSNFKDFLTDSNLFIYNEGHQNAFGSAISDEKFNDFIKYSNEVLKDINFNPCTKVDFIWKPFEFTRDDIINLASLKTIWGQELAEPHIAIEDINITSKNIQILSRDKSPTIKITLSNGVVLIKFKATEEEIEKLVPTNDFGSNKINVVGTCAINEWNGIITPQILVDDYEIVGNMRYYF